jgi:hypothetical protein
MEIVCFIEIPAELSREQLADSSFTSTRDTENDYDHSTLST